MMRALYLSFAAGIFGAVLGLPQSAPGQTAKKESSAPKDIGGKTVDQWVKEIQTKDPSKREAAVRALAGFGPEFASRSVPALLAEVKRGTFTQPIDVGVRLNIASTLGYLVGEAKGLEPKLIQDTVLELKRLLKDSQILVRYRAAQSLVKLGPDAKSTLPDLLTMSKDSTSWESRQVAAGALGVLGIEPKLGLRSDVVTELSKLANDNCYQVRLAAIQALSNVPPADPSQKPLLLTKLEALAAKDSEAVVQIWAHMAIMSLSQNVAPSHLTAIASHFRDADPSVRSQALTAIGTVGPKAKAMVTAIIPMLNDPDGTVLTACMWSLTRMEKDAAAALPALEKIAADPKEDEDVKKLAKDTIQIIKGGKK